MDALTESIKNALATNNRVSFSIVARRMEVKGVRDWYGRIIWEVTNQDNKTVESCTREGFETEEEAIQDFKAKYHPLPDSLQ